MIYQVGKLFEEGKTRYQEGVIFDMQQDGAVLLLYYNSPTENEIRDIIKGSFSLGFNVKAKINYNIIFMLFKFENQPWIDCPYSVHLSKPLTFEEIQDNEGISLHIFLIDADTGILKGMRLVGLPTEFSRKFKDAVKKQLESNWNETHYNTNVNMIYNSTTNDLVKQANIITKI